MMARSTRGTVSAGRRARRGTGDVLSVRALNRATLERQLLLQRWTLPALEAVERLAGLQAQAPMPPYTSLWSRLADFQPEELATLLVDRKVVRIALMRSTIHLVSAPDCLRWRPLVQPMLDKGFAGTVYGPALAGVDLAAVGARGRALVEERPLTFKELGTLLAEGWPDRDPSALAQAVRTVVPLVQVPPRGVWGATGQAAHTSAESWLGAAQDSAPSATALVRRYLAAFGPASVQDAQRWSGLTRLGEVVDELRPELRVFADESGRELFDLPDAPRPDPDTPAPARFLGAYDNLVLAHDDRTRVIADADRPAYSTINGVIPAAILVDGAVRGMWRIDRVRRTATLRIQPFGHLAKADEAALTEEGKRLLSFSATDVDRHDIEFAAPTT
jgi:Winged helix DNA-binding domain